MQFALERACSSVGKKKILKLEKLSKVKLAENIKKVKFCDGFPVINIKM